MDITDFEQGSVYRFSLMQEESVTIVFTSAEPTDVRIGSTISIGSGNGIPSSAAGTYVCVSSPMPQYDTNTGGYKYNVKFDKDYWLMANYIFKYKPIHGKEECSWKLTANINVFAKVLQQNFASATECGISGVSVGVNSGEAMALSFDGTSLLDAVNQIAEKWKCEWWVSGGTLNFGKISGGGGIRGFVVGENAESASISSTSLIPNKFYVYGSNRNIPHWYGKQVDESKVPTDLPLSCYKISLGTNIDMSPTFDQEDVCSLLYEGEHASMCWWEYKGSSEGTVYLDFGNPTVSVARGEFATGKIKMYLQYSDNGVDYHTIDSAVLSEQSSSEDKNTAVFHKLKTYFTTDTGDIYMRLLVELETDEDNIKGWVNVAPSFSPSAKTIEKDGYKKGALPYSCFKSNDESTEVAYGVVESRLNGGVKTISGDITKEAILVFDDIYPKSVESWNSGDLPATQSYMETTLDTGEVVKTYFRTYRTYIDSRFTSRDILSGKTLKVKFLDGSLQGMEFDAAYNPEGWSDLDERSHVIEIVRNNNYGRWLPDETLTPEGSTFCLLNFDISCYDEALIDDAEAELQTAADNYINTLQATSIESVDVVRTVEGDWCLEPGSGASVTLGNVSISGRVVGMEIPLDLPYDHPKYTIGNSAAYSHSGSMKSEIEGKLMNGTSYMEGGSNIYIITVGDGTAPGDGNVYSAKRCDGNYVSKNNNDTVNGIISFAQGLISMGIIKSIGKVVSMKGFESDDYHSGERGFSLRKEGDKTVLEVDNLHIRDTLSYNSINIKRRTYIGGSLVVSCGSAFIIKAMSASEIEERVEEIQQLLSEIENVTSYEEQYTAELQKELESYDGVVGQYRCWFRKEEGSTEIANDFNVDDLATCETYNLAGGQHYYWMRVAKVGVDYVDLTEEGIEVTRENDAPMAGDVLVQLGHCGKTTSTNDDGEEASIPTHPERQNAIFISADSTGAPLIKAYHGIDGCTLEGKEAVLIYYDDNTGKMSFKVYGDFYAGNHDGTSFAKFDGKKFEVSGVVKASAVYNMTNNEPIYSSESEPYHLNPEKDNSSSFFLGDDAYVILPNPSTCIGLQYIFSVDSTAHILTDTKRRKIRYKGGYDPSEKGDILEVSGGTIVLTSIPFGQDMGAQWRITSSDAIAFFQLSDSPED